jgi:hypothetical protein
MVSDDTKSDERKIPDKAVTKRSSDASPLFKLALLGGFITGKICCRVREEAGSGDEYPEKPPARSGDLLHGSPFLADILNHGEDAGDGAVVFQKRGIGPIA